MRLLAFDSSSDVLSVALFEEKRPVAAGDVSSGMRHSEAIWECLEELLRRAKWRARDIEAVAVGLGPGSFTGLRVGVTAAKLLSRALGAKLVGVSSLEAIAWPHLDEGREVALTLDARKGNVYGAIYKKERGVVKAVLKPSILRAELFDGKVRAGSLRLDRTGTHPSASAIAEIAYRRLASGLTDRPEALLPMYLHAKDCNVTLKKKKKT